MIRDAIQTAKDVLDERICTNELEIARLKKMLAAVQEFPAEQKTLLFQQPRPSTQPDGVVARPRRAA